MGSLLTKSVVTTQRQLTPQQKLQQNRLIEIGVAFMEKEGVQHIPAIQKKIFLRRKGLSEKIIQKVFEIDKTKKLNKYKQSKDSQNKKKPQ